MIDLFSRQVIGWSMKSNPKADLVIDALLMAVWRRKPKASVFFLKENNLEASMSRRGNCHDNAVAESFFSLLKGERIKKKIYKTRNEARSEVFNYIELFYDPKRRHGNNGGISPVEFEKQYFEKLLTV